MNKELNAAEAVYGFVGWLTTREERTVMSAKDDCAPIAELIKRFCTENNLPEVSDQWPLNLIHPSGEVAVPNAEASRLGSPELQAMIIARCVEKDQADSLQEDAARYRWLAASCRSTSEHWGGRWSIIIDGPAPKSHDSEDDFDAAVDAARKQGANQ